MKVLVIIPTYNEIDNIEFLIYRLLQMRSDIHILVVDDNSPDGTARLVKGIMTKNQRVHLLCRPKKAGLGTAYVAGFKWALAGDYDVIIEMDGDGSHRPRYIPKFLESIQDWDLIVGSRWIRGGGIYHWSLGRVILSRLANIYSQMILGVGIRDLTGGFTAYRRKVLESIDLDKIHSEGYSFQIEMKYRALKKNFRIKEVPIVFPDRTAGKSKISRKIVFSALWIVWVLRFTVKS